MIELGSRKNVKTLAHALCLYSRACFDVDCNDQETMDADSKGIQACKGVLHTLLDYEDQNSE